MKLSGKYLFAHDTPASKRTSPAGAGAELPARFLVPRRQRRTRDAIRAGGTGDARHRPRPGDDTGILRADRRELALRSRRSAEAARRRKTRNKEAGKGHFDEAFSVAVYRATIQGSPVLQMNGGYPSERFADCLGPIVTR